MRTVIRNIATLVSGDIHRPILDADSIEIEGNRITVVGKGLGRGRHGHRYPGLDRDPRADRLPLPPGLRRFHPPLEKHLTALARPWRGAIRALTASNRVSAVIII